MGDEKSQWTGRHHANVTALPSPDMRAHPWWQEKKGSGTCCLSAAIAARQLLLQSAGEAAWHAAELCGAGDGDPGGRLLGGTLMGFVAPHRHSGQSRLK